MLTLNHSILQTKLLAGSRIYGWGIQKDNAKSSLFLPTSSFFALFEALRDKKEINGDLKVRESFGNNLSFLYKKTCKNQGVEYGGYTVLISAIVVIIFKKYVQQGTRTNSLQKFINFNSSFHLLKCEVLGVV